jgi:hypothetical protein
MAQLIFTENREEFECMLLVGNDPKRPHTARMAGRAAKFIGGMSDRTRDHFLETALDFAWTNRHSFNTQYEALEMFWTRSLRAAAMTRDKWLVSVATLPGVYEKRWVLGRVLGE